MTICSTPRGINTNLFAGDWDLSYFDTETKESKPVQSTDTIGDYLNRNINTFYWSYKPVRLKFRSTTDLKRPLTALHLRKVVITDPGKVRPATD
ncbi:MAG: hypothetical protein IPN94_24935 [Sphingobacteriales bacterium]|nr:hypothetical protein [Sphingobacteriales bacterium]